MSSYHLKSDYNTIYFQMADITNMAVDVIINFVDYQNPDSLHFTILEKGGNSLRREFNEKWSQLSADFNRMVITGNGALPCKNVIHIANINEKPLNEGFYDALSTRISLCLQRVEEKNFKSVAFPTSHSGNSFSEIIFNCYCKKLPSHRLSYQRYIYCVYGDEDLEEFEKIKEDYKLIACESPVLLHKEAKVKTSGAVTTGPTDDNERCSICLNDITDRKILDKCGHSFCSSCIDRCFSEIGPSCPICQTFYSKLIGQQPPGIMTVKKRSYSLPGFSGYGTYIVSYSIPNGIQLKNHPNPGKTFYGTNRTAYLPNNAEGEIVLKMLQKAFQQKLIFTVGVSRTTNLKDCVTWNDIHHKTSMNGGSMQFGYPDPTYLKRVTLELEAKGIDAKSVAHESIKDYLISD